MINTSLHKHDQIVYYRRILLFNNIVILLFNNIVSSYTTIVKQKVIIIPQCYIDIHMQNGFHSFTCKSMKVKIMIAFTKNKFTWKSPGFGAMSKNDKILYIGSTHTEWTWLYKLAVSFNRYIYSQYKTLSYEQCLINNSKNIKAQTRFTKLKMQYIYILC